MASIESDKVSLPPVILSRDSAIKTVGDFINNMDLKNFNLFEKSKNKYRKPSYQRISDKSKEWQISLVESLVRGYTIGPIILSRWFEKILGDNGEEFIYDYYNIEDGQSRINALLNFKNGLFTTKYGKYEDIIDKNNGNNIFNSKLVPVETIAKSDSRIPDNKYFEALCENFQLLQEGTPLTASDRYWAHEVTDILPGSPLVNLTIELINGPEFHKDWNHYMGFSKLNSRTKQGRAKLADAIAFISTMWKGIYYANTKFYSHVDIINQEISDQDKDNIINILNKLFIILKEVEEKYPRQDQEKFISYFNNLQKFIGIIIMDIQENEEQENEDNFEVIKNKWVKVINHIREQSISSGKSIREWMEEHIYMNLTTGNKRNCSEVDFISRQNAINEWYEISVNR